LSTKPKSAQPPDKHFLAKLPELKNRLPKKDKQPGGYAAVVTLKAYDLISSSPQHP